MRSNNATHSHQTLFTPWTQATWCWRHYTANEKASLLRPFTIVSGLTLVLWQKWIRWYWYTPNVIDLLSISKFHFIFWNSDMPTTIRLSPFSAYIGRSFIFFGFAICHPSEVFNKDTYSLLIKINFWTLFWSGVDCVNDETPKGLARHRLKKIISEVPRRGTFDLRLVLKSVYFFS